MRKILRPLKRLRHLLRLDGSPRHDGHADLIKRSGLFDAPWYLSQYPDVARSGMDPVEHFLRSGAREGRSPGPGFDTIWYLSENYDVQAAGLNPLIHYLENKGQTFLSPLPLRQSQRFEAFNRAIRSGLLDGTRLFPQVREISFGPRLGTTTGTLSDLPLPPVELSLRIGSPTLEGFEIIGQEAKTTILRCLPPDFRFEGARCLDFGCGIGRVIRHFETEARTAEFWGCDIDGTSIQWNNENLSPPFRFFQLSDTPTIPLESSSFDLVYALSVFSQIYIDWQSLAMEIRRILKPNGVFFMSFSGQTSFEEMFRKSYHETLDGSGMYVDHPFQAWNKGGPNVGLSPDWIMTHWGSIFDIDYIAMDGFMDYQSICVMRKPPLGTCRAPADVPVLTLGTCQDFNPDAAGKIEPRFDASRPFRESYGIVGQDVIDVSGWIVFRNDRVATLDIRIDDVEVPASPVFHPNSDDYRDWKAPQVPFTVPLDLAALAKGEHRLTVVARSEGGLGHRMGIPLTVA